MPRQSAFYLIEALSAVGNTLLLFGIYFYTEHVFRWGLMENFLLAVADGLVYAVGALSAHALAGRFGRRRLLRVSYALLAGLAAAGSMVASPGIVVGLILVYTFFIAITWPALESLVSGQADAHEMSRRLSIYNLVWSGVGAAVLAVNGIIIERWQAGVFLIPTIAHVLGAMLLPGGRGSAEPEASAEHVEPEPELLAQRRLALSLSRISLPATYVVIYGTVAMFPLLPLMRELSPSLTTLVGSAWMVTRWLTFLALGATAWWHTRPMLLLGASIAMLAGYLGTVLPGNHAPMSDAAAIGVMVVAQAVLGIAVGLIYAASLYFGMVLSAGSTEHGGYHEALIGVGQSLGPGAGAVAQLFRPNSVAAGILAVAAVIATTVVAAAAAATRSRGNRH